MDRHAKARAGRAWSLAAAALLSVVGVVTLTASPAAAATSIKTTTDQDWAGYAAHGSGARFEAVSGRWRVPTATCKQGEQSFSSFWVGIGGYSAASSGLEQDGTELDCNANGTQSVSAWYELLPAGPHTISMTVRSGDLISASVHLRGTLVTLRISDLTSKKSFSKTKRDGDIDDTSAEWIAEAPAECDSAGSGCKILPLTDFGAVRFADASATTSAGVTGGISASHWTTTRLLLEDGTEETAFAADSTVAGATPSALADDNHEFEVTSSGTQTAVSPSSSGSESGGSGTGAGVAPNPGGGAQGVPNPGGAAGFGPGGQDGGGGPGPGP